MLRNRMGLRDCRENGSFSFDRRWNAVPCLYHYYCLACTCSRYSAFACVVVVVVDGCWLFRSPLPPCSFPSFHARPALWLRPFINRGFSKPSFFYRPCLELRWMVSGLTLCVRSRLSWTSFLFRSTVVGKLQAAKSLGKWELPWPIRKGSGQTRQSLTQHSHELGLATCTNQA